MENKNISALRRAMVKGLRQQTTIGTVKMLYQDENTKALKNRLWEANMPDTASKNCYVFIFKHWDSISSSEFGAVIDEIATKAMVAFDNIEYQGTVVEDRTAMVYFDVLEQKEPVTGLKKIVKDYGAAKRKDFINDLIKAIRQLAEEEKNSVNFDVEKVENSLIRIIESYKNS